MNDLIKNDVENNRLIAKKDIILHNKVISYAKDVIF